MKLMCQVALGLAAAATLACASATPASEEAVAPLTPLAHSALATLEVGSTATGLVLRVKHRADQTPLAVTDLSVSVDGQSQLAMRRPDGLWFVPLSEAPAHTGVTLEVVVAHDGVREILSGRIARPAAGSPAGGGVSARRDHRQLAWWILNIAIVLIAAIAISRRLS